MKKNKSKPGLKTKSKPGATPTFPKNAINSKKELQKPMTIEENNERIRTNISDLVTETIEYNIKMLVTSCGTLLKDFEDPKTSTIVIPKDIKFLKEELTNKLKMVNLLNFRRILNLIRTRSEPYLDQLVNFQQQLP